MCVSENNYVKFAEIWKHPNVSFGQNHIDVWFVSTIRLLHCAGALCKHCPSCKQYMLEQAGS